MTHPDNGQQFLKLLTKIYNYKQPGALLLRRPAQLVRLNFMIEHQLSCRSYTPQTQAEPWAHYGSCMPQSNTPQPRQILECTLVVACRLLAAAS
jgi:hypothetical protein